MAVLQDGVLSTVHLAHTALADLSDDFVMAMVVPTIVSPRTVPCSYA